MKKIMSVIAALALGAGMLGTAIAGGPGYSGDYDAFSSRSPAKSVSKAMADKFPGSGVVETGATVARSIGEDRIPPTSTHYNPQFPETRWQDLGRGGN